MRKLIALLLMLALLSGLHTFSSHAMDTLPQNRGLHKSFTPAFRPHAYMVYYVVN